MIRYRQLSSDEELTSLSLLAVKIWQEYYPPIIGQKQVDYMLGKMYSLEGLKQQSESGHTFVAAYEEDLMKGFLSFSKSGDGEFMIHKWYVDLKTQGKGIGRGLFEFAFAEKNFDRIKLTVNRQNVKAINFYFKFGFNIEKIIDMDIGDGYYMNDFVMVYKKKQ